MFATDLKVLSKFTEIEHFAALFGAKDSIWKHLFEQALATQITSALL